MFKKKEIKYSIITSIAIFENRIKIVDKILINFINKLSVSKDSK